jgi:PKD repeat protein
MVLLNCGDKDSTTEPTIPDPIASFSESGEPVTPATIVFQNTSQYADSYLWRFGDGETTTITNPTHTYDTHGDYSVSLTATNTTTNRSDIYTKTLSIDPGKVYITTIRINDIPFTDIYGSGWDLLTGPDVFADLVTSSSVIFTLRSYYRLDVSPSDLPIQWDFSQHFEIPDWSMVYYINIWDYDEFGDDYIGGSNGFRINDIITSVGYVSSIERQNNSGTIATTLLLRWE